MAKYSGKCHAKGCTTSVRPQQLFCYRHWVMVPKDLKDRIWATYVPGREDRKDPSPEYMAAYKAAVEAVAKKEGRL